LDHSPTGRIERRLPIIVVVRLAPLASASSDGERTFTDNISPHGARIFSKQPWQAGDLVRVTPLHAAAAFGEVVYCQKLPDDRFSVGVRFPERPVPWPTLRKYGDLLG